MQDDWKHRLGHALRKVRPGIAALTGSTWSGFLPFGIHVGSPAFEDGQPMPVRFTGDGAGVSPPVRWENLPEGTLSVVLLVEDADVPATRPLTHAIVHSIPPGKAEFAEGEVPFRLRGFAREGWACGRNALARPGWTPPNPPPGHGPHRYAFQVFALGAVPRYPYPPGRSLLLRTIRPHLLAQGRMIGTYERL
jgi:Raf kinase inhibitor-like YbhB/YbcL family protein